MERCKYVASKYGNYPKESISFQLLWGMFSYVDEDIEEAISKYDAGNTKLIIFGKWVYLDHDLVFQATNIPCRGVEILSSRKTPEQEKNQMASKICGREVNVLRNGLKMQDVPPIIYKNLIQIVLRIILNHHWDDISGECMWVVIHWVEDIPVDIPYLLA